MDVPAVLSAQAGLPVASTLDGWRGPGIDLDLHSADPDLLDLVLYIYPDLRATACLGQIARAHGLRYPIADVEQLVGAIGESRIELGDHVVDRSSVREAMREAPFPLMHEGEFLSAVHQALVRCRAEASVRRQGVFRDHSHQVEDGTRWRRR